MTARHFAVAAPLVLGGCEGVQNALGGQGAESANFTDLFIIFMAVCTFMYVLVVAGLFAAMWRRRSAEVQLTVETGKHHQSAPLLKSALIGWTALMSVGLVALAIASFFTDRSNAAASRNP